MKKILIYSFFNLLLIPAFSQTVINVYTVTEDYKIAVHYTISNAKYYQSFNVTLYVSMDGGKAFRGPLMAVSGDVGEKITKGDKKIIWDVFKDVAGLEGDVVFDVRVEVFEKERKKHIFVSYSGSYFSPFGIRFGQIGKTGWYIAARANSKFATKVDHSTDSTGIIDYNGSGYYEFDGKEFKKNYTVSAGFNFQCSWNFFIFIGAGYGTTQLLWHINEYSYPDDVQTGDAYAKHSDYSYSGLEIEAGITIRIKKILISAGAATLGVNEILFSTDKDNSDIFKELTEFTYSLGYNF